MVASAAVSADADRVRRTPEHDGPPAASPQLPAAYEQLPSAAGELLAAAQPPPEEPRASSRSDTAWPSARVSLSTGHDTGESRPDRMMK